MNLSRRKASLGLLALAALPAGCASPTPVLYTMDTVPGTARPGGPRIVLLQEIAVAPYLNRKSIVRSSANFHIDVETNDWWGEPFTPMLTRILTADLEQRLPGSTVFSESGAVDATPDATLNINISRFDQNESGVVVLVAQLAITWGSRLGRRPTIESMRYEATPTTPKVEGQISAMSTAFAAFADRVAQLLAR